MTLEELKKQLQQGQGKLSGCVTADSRNVKRGDVFAAMVGTRSDGHNYIDAAIAAGAGAIVVQAGRAVPKHAAAVCVAVDDTAEVFGQLSHLVQGNPLANMTPLGVTGTNGKTTTAFLVRAILNAAGKKCGLIGTVGVDLGDGTLRQTHHTTPDAWTIAEHAAAMRDYGCEAMVMECSSHALDQRRTAGIDFTAAAFTNLTGDHYDYHKTPQAYFNAKARLFESLKSTARAIINRDDPQAQALIDRCRCGVWTYGLDGPADLTASIEDMTIHGCQLTVMCNGLAGHWHVPLIGRYNVSNILAAAGLALAAGATMEHIAEGWRPLREYRGGWNVSVVTRTLRRCWWTMPIPTMRWTMCWEPSNRCAREN